MPAMRVIERSLAPGSARLGGAVFLAYQLLVERS